MIFKTKEITLNEIVIDKLEFLIPVYQRPYVWDKIEIIKLLEDLELNFKNNTEKKIDTNYFVGNTYVIKSPNPKSENIFEVIDGQQRFTTFWLISFCFKKIGINSDLTSYLEIVYDKSRKDIRFDFDIRKEVYEYLKGLLDGSSDRRFQDVSNLEFLKNIAAGIETIEGFLKAIENEINLHEFGNYIFKKVKFIFNEAPENTDLNALFVALGTSGIQLQQSDILKARLLDKITDKNQRIKYAKIWEACENMYNYFESNVKISFPYDTSTIMKNDFSEFNESIFSKNNDNDIFENKRNLTIDEILKFEDDIITINTTEGEQNSACRSIISFNVLLLHTFRIFKKQNGFTEDVESMDSKKLLEIIQPNKIENVEEFFLLLWRVRYLFDKYVVKWRNEEGEEISNENEKLLLTSIYESEKDGKKRYSRQNNENSEMQMLQSVLYYTGIFAQQYWLTPFIYFLLKPENLNNDDLILKELERVDNIMLPGDKKDISWDIINKEIAVPNFELIGGKLSKSSGTSFSHYWFYKLEYLLWKNWNSKEETQFKRYRITAKNSIEHVFSQNEEYSKNLDNLEDKMDWLNNFGNLALLSVGQNSSYSNQDVVKKRRDFELKDTYDSLKLAKIYNLNVTNWNWNSEEIKIHYDEMQKLFEYHYNAN